MRPLGKRMGQNNRRRRRRKRINVGLRKEEEAKR
jgi:hypothetical protein